MGGLGGCRCPRRPCLPLSHHPPGDHDRYVCACQVQPLCAAPRPCVAPRHTPRVRTRAAGAGPSHLSVTHGAKACAPRSARPVGVLGPGGPRVIGCGVSHPALAQGRHPRGRTPGCTAAPSHGGARPARSAAWRSATPEQ